MPGVVFLVVVPTANFEHELYQGYRWDNNELSQLNVASGVASNSGVTSAQSHSGSNMNINLPDNNTILRLEVELRDKNAPKQRRGRAGGGIPRINENVGRLKARSRGGEGGGQKDNLNVVVPLEKILEELLTKLEIEHVTWSSDKKGNYYHVVFPLQSGEPCETTLHCLTELGIGTKLNSSVSVLPCSVSYDAITDPRNKDENSDDGEELSKWNSFVESIKSKLTVKQVVDGVRAGGSLSFDYLLLIVTADSLAALGLVENNAPNIVAAMLVSPLMGPVMSITFATMISDRELLKVGFISLALGMFISILFGFIFGLILGTTDMPWGFSDWPTEEMRGRGNVRSLWMGVLWALTSGTGVAVALLQGSAGPLIGVAISASLLPPVVNCGLFWALACIWLIYPNKKIPHLKGEPYVGNSSYEFIYTNYLPTEFLINGIVSGLLTVVNVICIFITAIIVLKIKEVSAPYTASPDLKRFWETDIRTVRKTNRSTIRHKKTFKEKILPFWETDIRTVRKTNRSTIRHKKTFKEKILPYEQDDLAKRKNDELRVVLERALKEATDDATFKKVKRMSYSSNAAGELTQGLNLKSSELSSKQHGNYGGTAGSSSTTGGFGNNGTGGVRNSKLNADLQALDKLISSLFEQHNQQQQQQEHHSRKPSIKLNRWRPLSRSLTGLMSRSRGSNIRDGVGGKRDHHSSGNLPGGNNFNSSSFGSGGTSHASLMPTIMEQQNQSTPTNNNSNGIMTRKSSWTERAAERASSSAAGIREVLHSIANAPQRFSQTHALGDNEENLNLTKNFLD